MATVLIKVKAEAFALIDVGEQSEHDLHDSGIIEESIPDILQASATDYTWEVLDRNSPLRAAFKLGEDGVEWIGYLEKPQ